jgi:CubicO group peptidase (beta-lactamase class C family)
MSTTTPGSRSDRFAAADAPYTFDAATDPQAAADEVRAAAAAGASVHGALDQMLAETQTQAFIVIRDDTILYEGYFNGFERDSIATSFSIAKSYASALVGIAVDEGDIGSLDDPITDYLPELRDRDARFAEITIRHLLDMCSGLRYDEIGLPNGDDALTYYFDDLPELALERSQIVEPPERHWLYNNYNPILVGLILERATGRSVSDLLAEKIWTRIGTEFPASWSLDSEDGFEKMESGINARAIDFAKLGRLYLDEGRWDDEGIVPADWVAASTLQTSERPDGYYPASMEQPYGTIAHESWWWRIALPDGTQEFSALGNHGQFVFVAPAQDLVIVRFGREYGMESFEWFDLFTTLADGLATGP